MVQQAVNSKFSECGLGSTEPKLHSNDKQPLVSVKKTALRELQNENRMVVPNSANPPCSKDRVPVDEAVKVSGFKRPTHECHLSPSGDIAPNSNAANGHLVYVRRRIEAEVGKNSTSDSATVNADNALSKSAGHPETCHPKPQMKEPKFSSFPAFAPIPTPSFLSSSGKPSVPLLGKSGTKLPADSNHRPGASAAVSFENPRAIKAQPWEERYHQLQVHLKNLDQSNQEDYVQSMFP